MVSSCWLLLLNSVYFFNKTAGTICQWVIVNVYIYIYWKYNKWIQQTIKANITVNINTVSYSLVSNPSISLWLLQTIQSLYSDMTQSTISVRNCLQLQYTNNTLFCFSLYNSLTIIVQIAPIVLLIINFASDVYMSMFEYLAVKVRFLPV